jgi:uncharacterized repeat protein (TIGR03803 family)
MRELNRRCGTTVLVVACVLLAAPASGQYAVKVLHGFAVPPATPSGRLIEGSDGAIYGTTYSGGASGHGTVFRMAKDGTGLTVLHEFEGTAGGNPEAGLIEGSDGFLYGSTDSSIFKIGKDGTGFATLGGCKSPRRPIEGSDGLLYGACYVGGASDDGSVFKIGKDGSGFTTLLVFTGTNGALPHQLIEGSDGALYGTTTLGGAGGGGTAFTIAKDGTGFTTLRSFDGTNSSPNELIEGLDGALYGTTCCTSTTGHGTVFTMGKDGTGFVTLFSFNGTNGATPKAGLTEGLDGALYGTTGYGGASADGTVFKIAKDGTGFATLFSFNGANGAGPEAALLEGSDGALYGTTFSGGAGNEGTVFKIGKDGAGFSTLFQSSSAEGFGPYGPIEASDGVLYGTTERGGASGWGTVFKIDSDGSGFTTLFSFDGTNGGNPRAGVIEGSDGFLYGTTENGGASDKGTVFKVGKSGGGFAKLHDFNAVDGCRPHADLLEASDGYLYGTTRDCGSSGYGGMGTVFRVRIDGTGFTKLLMFGGTAGEWPEAGLIEGSDGFLYGTASSGGAYGYGDVFKIGKDGAGFATLFSFYPALGIEPYTGLVEGSDGALYGTTGSGPGPFGPGILFRIGKDGTGFATLFSFGGTTGANPSALVEGSDGALYGTTGGGPPNWGSDFPNGYGTGFKLGLDGSGFKTESLFNGANGIGPHDLVEGSDGTFYGTTSVGGPGGGVVFQLVPSPTADPTPNRLSFGDQKVGTPSGAQPLTITNNADPALHVTAIRFTGTNAGDFSLGSDTCSGASVVHGASCFVNVLFQPIATGSRSATLEIDDDAWNSPQKVGLDGTGIAPAVSLDFLSLSFATQILWIASAPRVVTLSNTGTAALTITSLSASGDFSQTNTCGANLPKGSSCAISVRFTPTDVGPRSGTLTVVDDASGSPRAVDLSGTGVALPIRFSKPSFSANEAGSLVVLSVTRPEGASGAATVDYATIDGTATAGADYTATAGQLSFAPGVITQTFVVKLIPDTLHEAPETFLASLSNPQGAGAKLGTQRTAVVAIADNDAGGRVQFSLSAYTVNAGGAPASAQLAVKRSGGLASPVTVHFATSDGTAAAGADYTQTSGDLTFTSSGVGATSQGITIPVSQNALAAKAFTVTLSSATGGAVLGSPTTATVTILGAEPTLAFSSANYTTKTTQPSALVAVKRSAPLTGTVTVSYATSPGTAAGGGVDYTDVSGALTFAPGVSSRAFAIPIAKDPLVDVPKTVDLTLSGPSWTGGTAVVDSVLGSAVLTIVNPNAAPTLQFSAATYAFSEATPSATIMVRRTGDMAGTVTVDYAAVGGTATSGGVDYTLDPSSLTFAPAVSVRAFTIPIVNDSLDEGTETVILGLSNPKWSGGTAILGPNGTAVLKLVDNEPTVQFSAPAYSVGEAAKSLLITVRRTGAVTAPATVMYDATGGTAVRDTGSGGDYALGASTLTFAPGQTAKTFTITLEPDTVSDGTKTISLGLSNPVGAALGTPSASVVTISDNDLAGKVQFSATDYSVAETAGLATLTVTRMNGTSGEATLKFATVDLDPSTTAVAGTDYASTSGTLTFGLNEKTKTITIPVFDDGVEGTRALSVRLTLDTPANGLALGSPADATLWIVKQ